MIFPRPFHSPLSSFAALAVAGILGSGCFPKGAAAPGPLSASEVSTASAKWPGTTEAALASGRETFVGKCNGCHKYPDVGSVPEGHWPEVMQSMGRKAGLDPAQKESVLRFILVARARPVAPPG